MKPTPVPEIEVGHAEFAHEVLHNRRAAIGLTVEQIQQMAAAILLLDHDLQQSRDRAASMLAEMVCDRAEPDAEPTEKTTPVKPVQTEKHIAVQIPRDLHNDDDLSAAIVKFVKAGDLLKAEKFGPNEGMTRARFEKASLELADKFKPKIRRKTS